jgi:sigma-B regulation protein RsbU (phosphoserine phosphatase)
MPKILVIDDDPVIQLILRKTLQDQGYEVATASSGEAGIEQAKQWHPALVICDWLMPGIDGLEVCCQLKADPTLSGAFFILLTSRSAVEDRVQGLDTGADDFLAKPIEVSELLARVRAWLRLHQATQQLQQLAHDLRVQKQRLETELAEAADYVASLLPIPLTGAIRSEAVFLPSKQLGGDCFDYYWLDPDCLMLYLLDVSGHGLGSALLSVSIQNLMRSQSLSNVDFYRPDDVLHSLNTVFQMNEQNPRYFSLWYGVYHRLQRRLSYASAGHPPAVLISPTPVEQQDGPEQMLRVQQLKTRGAPIGMMMEANYVSASCTIPASSTLFVFSDGVYELKQTNGTLWGLEQLIELLSRHVNLNQPLAAILADIQTITGIDRFEDDFSLLQLQFS